LAEETLSAAEEPTDVALVTDGEEPSGDPLLSPEQNEQARLSRRPDVSHLHPGVDVLQDGTVLPLFDAGERVVVERRSFFLKGNPWLHTRCYVVDSIDDDAGFFRAQEEGETGWSFIGFNDPLTKVYLAPRKGNPFSQPRRVADAAPAAGAQPPGAGQPQAAEGQEQPKKRGRGRPKGSKNRPKEVVAAEKRQRAAERNAKRAARERRKAARPQKAARDTETQRAGARRKQRKGPKKAR